MYPLGVFIEDVSGILYKYNSWDSSKTPNSIVVISKMHRFRISLIEDVKLRLGGKNDYYGTALANYLPLIPNINNAWKDFNGYENTQKLIEWNISDGTNNTSYSAPYCAAFTFPDGQTKGYMYSAGELKLMYDNKTEIDLCLAACGGSPIHVGSSDSVADAIKTSTLASITSGIYGESWRMTWGNGAWTYNKGIDVAFYIRPVGKYE